MLAWFFSRCRTDQSVSTVQSLSHHPGQMESLFILILLSSKSCTENFSPFCNRSPLHGVAQLTTVSVAEKFSHAQNLLNQLIEINIQQSFAARQAQKKVPFLRPMLHIWRCAKNCKQADTIPVFIRPSIHPSPVAVVVFV